MARAATIPAQWYTDPAFLDFERQKIFWRARQPVGHASDVTQPGDYFVVGEPLVVARGKDGILRASALRA